MDIDIFYLLLEQWNNFVHIENLQCSEVSHYTKRSVYFIETSMQKKLQHTEENYKITMKNIPLISREIHRYWTNLSYFFNSLQYIIYFEYWISKCFANKYIKSIKYFYIVYLSMVWYTTAAIYMCIFYVHVLYKTNQAKYLSII
jgi:hypothetical protein